MWKKWKRIACGILIAAMVLTELPMSVMATSNLENTETEARVFGDADGDGELNARDIEAILQYIVENEPSGFQFTNVDVTDDGVVDLKDLLAIRKRMAEAGQEMLSVSFYDGGRLIDTLYVVKDSPLKKVPSVGKSSKANAVLLGYYTDPACTMPFYAENPVTENMNVYAKYQEMDFAAEELNFTSFAQMDQSPDLSFRIKRVSGNISSESAAVLVVKDGSDPVALKIVSDGDGCYKVYAPEGFRKGSSYELNLAEGWVFEGKEETIRTAAFSIEMGEMNNLKMSDAIIYIKDTDTINYTVGGEEYAELTSKAVTENGGYITYGSADESLFENVNNINEDDILCIYVGVHPKDRNSDEGEQLLDPIVYVKATDVQNGKISFAPLKSEEQARMYDIPDNFPIALKGLNIVTDDTEIDSDSENVEDEEGIEIDGGSENVEDEEGIEIDGGSENVEDEEGIEIGSDSENADDEDGTEKDSDSENADDEDGTETDSDSDNAKDEGSTGTDNDSDNAEDEGSTGTNNDSDNVEDEGGADKDTDSGKEGTGSTGTDSGSDNTEGESSADKDSASTNMAMRALSKAAGKIYTVSVRTDKADSEGTDGDYENGIPVGRTTAGENTTSVSTDNADDKGTVSESESGTPEGGDAGSTDNADDKGADGESEGETPAVGDTNSTDNADDKGTVSESESGTPEGGDAGSTDNADDKGTVSESESRTPEGGDAGSANNTDGEGTDSESESGTSEGGDAGSANNTDGEGTDSKSEDGTLTDDDDNNNVMWQPDLESDKGTVKKEDLLAALDLDMYRRMMNDEDLKESDVWEKLSIGDFITLYSSSDEIESEDSLYYAQITDIKEIPVITDDDTDTDDNLEDDTDDTDDADDDVDDTDGNEETTYEITYERTTKQAILESMDVYEKALIEGDDLVSEAQKQEIEAMLLSQLEESGFAYDAAYLLSDMITKTDGFRKNMSVQEFLLTDEEGNLLTDEEIQLLNLGGSFELTDDISLEVELITNGEQLHFRSGVQLAVKVEAKFEVEVEDGKVAIDLSASFVQEVALNPSVRGGIVTKEILFIPIPIGVEVNAAIDIKSYTAFSFAAEIYTVAEEDKSTWEKLQAICKDPKELLGLEGLPDGLKDGLKTVGDAIDKINEIKSKIDQASETVDKINGYKEDLETLWNLVETTGLTNREEWEQMEETLGKTSVASDLLDMMNLTTDTEISTEYLDSMQALMDKYVETVEKETDWVQLVNKEIMSKEFYLGSTPIVVGAEVNFVVRADMSIAIGSNLEYEVGKRYNFWFKIGLFKPTAGSSSMDLLDERFAFQFYVMGRLGLKAGIRAKLYVGLGSGKFASVGITAELGPYVKLYGFFVYEYTQYRPANTQNWTSNERMAGALYLDFGLYFMLGFEANALGNLFEYSYDFLDEEVPLLTAGESRYYYQNAYQPTEDDMVIVRDEDGNSTNGVTMLIPEDTIALSYVDLDTGWRGSEAVDYQKYHYTVSNPKFQIDPTTGVISVDVPENTRYMECDLTVTYLYGKMALSQYDMSVTIPLVWTNLSTDELNEFYTASVRVGNDSDGYQTVWRKRLLKNQPFDLPTDAEIKEMIGWSDAKFVGGAGYGSQPTTGLTLIQNTAYNYNVDYKTYSVNVEGIQNADGTTRSEVYTAKYGEKFDFSDLVKSGKDIPGDTYTKFAGVKTDKVIQAGGKQGQVIDLTENITGRAAEAIDNGINVWAEYVDDSVMARFEFTGINYGGVEQKIRKGSIPNLDIIVGAMDKGAEDELDVLNITPDCNLRVNAPIVYQVIFGKLTGPKATVVFHENGGNDVNDITKVVGGYLGILPTPERTGYSFSGWYTDDGTFQNRYEETKMSEGGANLYAQWTVNEYIVTFHENGGNELNEAERTKTVTYGGGYGSLPVPDRSGYVFTGWFTAAEGGTQITTDTSVAITERQTLYAHWRQLKQIPSTVFNFGEAEKEVYSKGMSHNVIYSFNAGGENFTQDSFTVKYMRQGNSEYETGLPVNAGTYNATISRPADDYYDKYEYTYSAVITIDKAVRTIGTVELETVDKGYTFVELALIGDGGIDDLSDEASFTYRAKSGSTVVSRSADRDSYVYDLSPAKSYNITVKVTDDPNYEDAESTEGVPVSTLEAPTDSWVDEGNYSTAWYDGHEDEDTFVLETAKDLAGLSALLKAGRGNSFIGKTIKLAEDIDLRGHKWYPIACQTIITTNNYGIPMQTTKSVWFKGTFDGQNHKITGLYISGGNAVGLFGRCGSSGTVKNVLLDHSYVRGGCYVGGIAGVSSHGIIDNCVNYAQVIGTSTDDNEASTGGIVGYCSDDAADTRVVNCVNYGSVQASGNHTGGIVGYLYTGEVRNNANYGRVTGTSCVGGIVGESYRKTGKMYNNFTVGTVRGTGVFVGAVVGRINGNDGDADQCYYLRYSATCNGSYRNAVGKDNKAGSLDDGKEGFNNAYFTSPSSRLSRTCESGATNDNLKGALNRWVTRCSKEENTKIYAEWIEGSRDGYPIPKNSPIPDAVDTRVR